MKSLQDVGYSILNSIKGYFTSDDNRIDIELIYDKIWDVYSKLKMKYKDKYGYLNPSDFSQRCCLDVQCRKIKCITKPDDPNVAGNQEESIESETLQYYVELPALDWYAADDPIAFFGSDDFSIRFSEKSINGFAYQQYDTYTSGVPSFTIVGEEAILNNLPTSSISKICIIGVFEEPGDKCHPEDAFPAPRAFLFELELMVKRDLLATMNITPDLLNNANDIVPQAPVNVPSKTDEE